MRSAEDFSQSNLFHFKLEEGAKISLTAAMLTLSGFEFIELDQTRNLTNPVIQISASSGLTLQSN